MQSDPNAIGTLCSANPTNGFMAGGESSFMKSELKICSYECYNHNYYSSLGLDDTGRKMEFQFIGEPGMLVSEKKTHSLKERNPIIGIKFVKRLGSSLVIASAAGGALIGSLVSPVVGVLGAIIGGLIGTQADKDDKD